MTLYVDTMSTVINNAVADPGFPVGGGAPTRWGGGGGGGGGANLRCVHFSAKTYVKMKEIDPVGGARAAAPPWIRQCNWYWSEWFPLSSSCRQGCPISGNLFNLVIEVLGDKIRNNPEIRGILINGQEIKGAQFATDLWLVLIYDRQNIDTVKNVFALFQQFSGLQINHQKTTIMPIGSLSNIAQPLFNSGYSWSIER